ncbi:MAG: hypothetical protein JWQ07_4043 [Ramlibacter sp.]|nr:hypothetical protein [Ramlibacter sp.]
MNKRGGGKAKGGRSPKTRFVDTPALQADKSQPDSLARVKRALQEGAAMQFEHFLAEVISQLAGVPVYVLRSGYQAGADAAATGARHLRVECKRYQDSTALSERELLGEIEQACTLDPALELWVLATTRAVDGSLRASLRAKGEKEGIAVEILDWGRSATAVPDLAALCVWNPALLLQYYPDIALSEIEAVKPFAAEPVAAIHKNFETWNLGFERLRSTATSRLKALWTKPEESWSQLNQMVAGGTTGVVQRVLVNTALDAWWARASDTVSPLALIGRDGVGKTWAAVSWLRARHEALPITLCLSSAAASRMRGATEYGVLELIGEQLFIATGTRDVLHWIARARRLLQRPPEEGTVLLLLLDGIEQAPSSRWEELLRVLQGSMFKIGVRVVLTCRTYYFEETLGWLRTLASAASAVLVQPYDKTPGGELDQALQFHDLRREHFPPNLIDLICVPRLLTLVIRIRCSLPEQGLITVHRLLLEYGKDTLNRPDRSFGAVDWEDWLVSIARQYMKEIEQQNGNTPRLPVLTVRQIIESVARRDLQADDVSRRLGQIVDGPALRGRNLSSLELSPETLHLALAVALVRHLELAPQGDVKEALLGWLDTVRGIDEVADILDAAVALCLAKGQLAGRLLPAILNEWLRCQTFPERSRRDLAAQSPALANLLLDILEEEGPFSRSPALELASDALRAVPSTSAARNDILSRLRAWNSIVYGRRREESVKTDGSRGAQLSHLRSMVGRDEVGRVLALGHEISVVPTEHADFGSLTASVLKPGPLADAVELLLRAAVASSLEWHDPHWQGLKWLVLLNEVDAEETRMKLRRGAKSIQAVQAAPPLNSVLPSKVATLLLWMCGTEEDEQAGIAIAPAEREEVAYESAYLADPGASLYPLEYRHVGLALSRTDAALGYRINRTSNFLADPKVVPSVDLLRELRAAAYELDLPKIHAQRSHSREDYDLDVLEPALARFEPEEHIHVARRLLREYLSRRGDQRYMAAVAARKLVLLVGPEEAAAALSMRNAGPDSDANHEHFIAAEMLKFELLHAPPLEQLALLADHGLGYFPIPLLQAMKQMPAGALGEFINQRGTSDRHAIEAVFAYLAMLATRPPDDTLQNLLQFTESADHDLRNLAFVGLAKAAPVALGEHLWLTGWHWEPTSKGWMNRDGATALASGTPTQPFSNIADRIGPADLIRVARAKGGNADDIQLAATILGAAIDPPLEFPKVEADFSVARNDPDGKSRYSVKPRRTSHVWDDEATAEALQETVRKAVAAVAQARAAGASLLLADISLEDARIVVQHARTIVGTWLEGMEEGGRAFRRRVAFSDGLFVSLCEALLELEPSVGASLWRSLNRFMMVSYRGVAGVNELVLMLFRVPDSSDVNALRQEVLSIENCNTDLDLFELVLAALAGNGRAWLQQIIERDLSSPHLWHRKRALILDAFSAEFAVNQMIWPTGPSQTSWEVLRRLKSVWGNRYALFRHWWANFIAATTVEEAYSAWTVFASCADRRAWLTIGEDLAALREGDPLSRLKLLHFEANKDDLRRSMEDHEKKGGHQLDGQLFMWTTPTQWMRFE